jgi:choice-of-anchor C domain-containing protein
MKVKIASLGVLGTMAVTASANLLVNGSFEQGEWVGNASTSYNTLPTGSTNISGWVTTQQGCDWHQSIEFSPAFDGFRMVDLTKGSALGGISQTFGTLVGSQYQVVFHMAGPKSSFQNPRKASAKVGTSTWEFSCVASSENSMIWETKSFSFTATASQSTLEFIGNGVSQYWGPVIDDVSVQAVPEPATLLALGAGLVACRYRRKR